ncbi:MAG TPA: translation initiation factor IF-2 [Gemmatimonadaceae bacterium]
MSKLRVTDMAGEFGIPADEVINLLRQMDIPVRSHVSPLTDDQVARVRARWEREKRARSAAPAPAAGTRRRRGAAAPAAAPVAEPEPAPTVRRRRAAEVAHEPEEVAAPPAPVVEAAPVPVEAPTPSRPRTPAPVAEPVAEAKAAPAPEMEVEKPAKKPKPVPVSPAAPEPPAAARAEPEPQPEPARQAPAPVQPPTLPAPPAPRPELQTAHSAPTPATQRPQSARPDRPRPTPLPPLQPRASATPPRPLTPGGPRPRPGSSSNQRQGGGGGGGSSSNTRPTASAASTVVPGTPSRESRPRPTGDRAPARQDDRSRGRGRGRRVDQEAVSANIFKTMTSMRGSSRKGAPRRDEPVSREEVEAQRKAAVEKERKTVRVNEFVTVAELAQQLKVPGTQIVAFAFKNLGLMVSINQRLDFGQIELIAGEFGFQAVLEDEYAADTESLLEKDAAEDLTPRPPVITIMGHVDHGKTSLLDYIRKAHVVAGESGGITQHIGAYHVSLPGGRAITFLDTPGHQAFTAMRARGAQVTDIVILVVAADDQVMPQTIEAISHAKNAGVPMIVAINKIDLPGANPMKVKQDLLQHGVVLEEFGGTTLASEISAKTGQNVPALLDQLILQAEILDLKANPDRRAVGSVVEAQLDPGKGPVATVLVQNGTLHVGDDFICGMYSGRVRALLDERGRNQKSAGPAIPVQVLGIGGVPMAGDQFLAVEDATASREIAQRRQRLDREARSRRTMKGSVSLEDFMSQTAPGQARALRIVIKADQGGPAEALADALGQLSTSEVTVEVIHRGVGAITESDILLARASGAIIIGFHVRPDNNARNAAEREGVEIKLYKIIYEAVEDVKLALEGMLRPEEREVVLGDAQVRDIFKVSRVGVIAGCSVRNGIINRTGRIRVIRDGIEIYDGIIGSLRRFKDDVKEVREGFECGIGVENFNDIKIGDILECYTKEQVARTLASSAAAS